MRPGCAAGCADVADTVPPRDRLSGPDDELTQMSVAGEESERVPQDDQIAVVAGVGSRINSRIRRGVDRIALVGRDIDSLVEPMLAGERVLPSTETVGQPAVGRPDRRRRGRQFLAFLPVPTHVAESTLERLEQEAEDAKRILRR